MSRAGALRLFGLLILWAVAGWRRLLLRRCGLSVGETRLSVLRLTFWLRPVHHKPLTAHCVRSRLKPK